MVWRKLAEICNEYLRKGTQVYIEGRLQTRTWEDQGGQKRYMTEVVVSEMVMLGEGGGTGRQGPSDEDAPPPSRYDSQDMLPNSRDGNPGKAGANDDLPF